jgi:hypothetical protein
MELKYLEAIRYLLIKQITRYGDSIYIPDIENCDEKVYFSSVLNKVEKLLIEQIKLNSELSFEESIKRVEYDLENNLNNKDFTMAGRMDIVNLKLLSQKFNKIKLRIDHDIDYVNNKKDVDIYTKLLSNELIKLLTEYKNIIKEE